MSSGLGIAWQSGAYYPEAMRKQSPFGAVSCYDLARDLAGKVKGLPTDLADNPKHMKGFGE